MLEHLFRPEILVFVVFVGRIRRSRRIRQYSLKLIRHPNRDNIIIINIQFVIAIQLVDFIINKR